MSRSRSDADDEAAPQRGADALPRFEPFEVRRSERVYDSPWCGLRRDLLRLDGQEALQEYHVFEVADAVAVVPVLPDGSILMLWQYRYPHGKTHWEVPAGRIHDGEDPAVAAVRELREETGHTSAHLEPLPGFYPMNGITAHFAHAFLARDCTFEGPVELDAAERIEVRVLPRDEVARMLREGEIADGFTALALHYALARD